MKRNQLAKTERALKYLLKELSPNICPPNKERNDCYCKINPDCKECWTEYINKKFDL